jgi:hypothetical protein
VRSALKLLRELRGGQIPSAPKGHAIRPSRNSHNSTAAGSAPPAPGTVWIVASDSDGEMRLAVQGDPTTWTPAVFRAAALVELCDRHHRAGNDKAAETAALQLEAVLERLREEGIDAWLTS